MKKIYNQTTKHIFWCHSLLLGVCKAISFPYSWLGPLGQVMYFSEEYFLEDFSSRCSVRFMVRGFFDIGDQQCQADGSRIGQLGHNVLRQAVSLLKGT